MRYIVPILVIQEPGTITAAVAASAVCTLTFLGTQLLIHFSFHELASEPLQHVEYRVRLRYTFQQQFCEICGMIFVSP